MARKELNSSEKSFEKREDEDSLELQGSRDSNKGYFHQSYLQTIYSNPTKCLNKNIFQSVLFVYLLL